MIGSDDPQKVWDEAAEPFAHFVREGKNYYRDELDGPTAFGLIGEVKGSRILDLACGEGNNTRILARKGAEAVGVDYSEKMIELVKQEEKKDRLGIAYFVADAADLRAIEQWL